jgi:nicotinic acid mononucleotide adenylyltransferase
VHHIDLVRAMAKSIFFHEVVVIPCGRRSDKSYVDNKYRVQMTQYAFSNVPKVTLDLRNLKDDIFTSNYHLENIYRKHDVVFWHAIGSDLLVPSNDGLNPIKRRWTEGAFIWENFCFLVIPRTGYPIQPQHLPKRQITLQGEFAGSSTDVRIAIQKGNPFKHLVDPQTYNLIVKEHLYR